MTKIIVRTAKEDGTRIAESTISLDRAAAQAQLCACFEYEAILHRRTTSGEIIAEKVYVFEEVEL